ncbi:MAG: helix-turn-helix domain-containing protein [Limisphaerales bacterium]
MKPQQILGTNVRRLREAKGWSQEDLAENANLHRTYVSGIERGVRNPSLTIVFKLATALGVEPGTLVNRKASKS